MRQTPLNGSIIINPRILKLKRCAVRECRAEFSPFNSMQRVCSPDCALKFVKQKKNDAYSKETKQLKKVANDGSLKYWKGRAKTACHRFIRNRDAQLACISCGREMSDIWDAGHYKSRGAMPELMFHHFNINKQCRRCNYFKADNDTNHRANLIKKIGLINVDWLESKHHKHYKYTIDDYKGIHEWFLEQNKLLQLVR